MLVGLLVAVITATASIGSEDEGETPTRPSPRASEAPATATGAPVPLAIASPEPPRPSRPPLPSRPSQPTTMDAATPVRLQVPAIGVDSDLMELGLLADGTLQVPPTGFPAGWYTGAPTPGELGPAIIAGHVDWGGEPGVFFDLGRLAPGDEITVARDDGTTAQFRVDRVQRFAKDAFPTALVYGDVDHAGLRLITCGGDFDRQARSYEDNVVVFAALVEGDPPGPDGLAAHQREELDRARSR